MGFIARIRKATTAALAASLTPASSLSSWWYTVRESTTGAWQRNVEVNRDNVLAYWAVYACIRQIAGDIAKMRLKLVEKSGGIWTEVESDSPFLMVLRKPNHYQTRVQFWMHWVTSLLIHGNTYVLKERDQRGVVRALYILDPLRVTVLVGDDGSVWYRCRPDNLSNIPTVDGEVAIPASEILHDRGVCLFHPLIGVSPIFACGVAATQGLAIQNNSANFFANGSMPGGIITVPGQIDATKAAALKAAWDTAFTGENRGKTAVLGDKMTYQALSISAKDAELIGQLRMSAEMVCACFGVPTYKVGVTQPPANSNVGAQDQNYYSQTIQPIIEGTELVLDEGLGLVDVPGKTLGTEFDLKALIRMDPAAQMEFAEKGVAGGVIKPNEARADFDLPPVAGGDSCYLQQQNYSLAALAKRDAQENPFGAATPPEPAPEPEPEEEPDDGEDAAAAALAKVLDDARLEREAFVAEQRAQREQHEASMRGLVDQLRAAVTLTAEPPPEPEPDPEEEARAYASALQEELADVEYA